MKSTGISEKVICSAGKEISLINQAIGLTGVHLKNLFSSPVIFQ